MSVKIHQGHQPYSMIWKIELSDEASSSYQTEVFSLERAEWRIKLDIEARDDWRMTLQKLHPVDNSQSFVISVYLEDKNRKLQCMNIQRSSFGANCEREQRIMMRRKQYVRLKYPDIVMDGAIMFMVLFLPDQDFVVDMRKNKEDKRIQTPSFLNVAPCLESLSMDLEKLLDREDEKDVELHCPDGRVLKAHRGVLSSRSDVFAAMLDDHDTIERSKGAVKIDDVDYDTMLLFLRYLYTGALPELNFELASGLYEVGDKYAVLSLRNRCANFLRENLSEDNACDILILSDTRNDKDLKECVLTYVIRNDLVVSLCEESAIRDTHPKLGFDVLFRAYKLTRRSYK